MEIDRGRAQGGRTGRNGSQAIVLANRNIWRDVQTPFEYNMAAL
jgi:hypothetical protein